MDPFLEQAKELFGGPRFYRPGQHPATARYRCERARLRELPPSKERNEALDYIDATLAAFEEGESIAKADYLRYGRRR